MSSIGLFARRVPILPCGAETDAVVRVDNVVLLLLMRRRTNVWCQTAAKAESGELVPALA